jgi:hypothetical protein
MLPIQPRVCEAQRVMVSRTEWHRLENAQYTGNAADFLRFFTVIEPMFEDTDRPTDALLGAIKEAFSEWWYRGVVLFRRQDFTELTRMEHTNRVASAGYPSSLRDFSDWQSIVRRHCADPSPRAENARHPVSYVPPTDLAEVQRIRIAPPPRVGVMESIASQQAGLDEIRARAGTKVITVVANQDLKEGQVITPDMIETIPDWMPVDPVEAAPTVTHVEPRTKKVARRTTTHSRPDRRPASAGIPVTFPVKVQR